MPTEYITPPDGYHWQGEKNSEALPVIPPEVIEAAAKAILRRKAGKGAIPIEIEIKIAELDAAAALQAAMPMIGAAGDSTFQQACIDAIKLLEDGGYGAPGKPNTLRAMAAEAATYRQKVAEVLERLRAEMEAEDDANSNAEEVIEFVRARIVAAQAKLGLAEEAK